MEDIQGENSSAAAYWHRKLKPYMRANNRAAAFQLGLSALLYGIGWAAMYKSLEGPYWVTLLLALPTAGLLIRLFIIQHDCGHGSYFSSQRANDIVGSAIGLLMLTPYAYWRRTHAIHHASSGDLDRRSFGDIETLTVDEYRALSWKGRLGYRLYRNPVLLFGIGPAFQFIFKHRLPLDIPRSWTREWASVMKLNVAILVAAVLAWATIGLEALVLVQLPITLISGGVGMWLFYVQHQFEDTYWRHNPEWDFHRAGLEGSSFYDLGPILHWFTGNIGYHHIHHLSSRIPNYTLPRAYRELPELQDASRLTPLTSLKCLWLRLWDEDRGKLVGFGG